MSEIEYRAAVKSDLDDLVELWWVMQSSHDTYDPEFYRNTGPEKCKVFWANHFKELLTHPDYMIWVAVSGKVLVGMIVGHLTRRPLIYRADRAVEIYSTVVHPSYRRRGIFRNLLKPVERKAKALGINLIELSVDRDNPGKRAYEGTGFYTRVERMIKWLPD